MFDHNYLQFSLIGYGHFRSTALVSKLVKKKMFQIIASEPYIKVLEYLNRTHSKHLSFDTLHSCPVIRGNAKIAGLPTAKQTPYEEKEDLHV